MKCTFVHDARSDGIRRSVADVSSFTRSRRTSIGMVRAVMRRCGMLVIYPTLYEALSRLARQVHLSSYSCTEPGDTLSVMNKRAALSAILLTFAGPAIAVAASVDATLIPDGTYVVKVEKVDDAQHAMVMMNNGIETTLMAMGGASFGKVKAGDTIKVSIVKGKVPVMAIQ